MRLENFNFNDFVQVKTSGRDFCQFARLSQVVNEQVLICVATYDLVVEESNECQLRSNI